MCVLVRYTSTKVGFKNYQRVSRRCPVCPFKFWFLLEYSVVVLCVLLLLLIFYNSASCMHMGIAFPKEDFSNVTDLT